jgi:hypothetical protein
VTLQAAADQDLIGDSSELRLRQLLAHDGLTLDLGAAVLRVRSDSEALAGQIRAAYGRFPVEPHGPWADLHVSIRRVRGLRRWVHPQVSFDCDGRSPFAPFPADSPLPMLEWGSNWLIGHRMNNLLLLHAGVVERDGLALVMPAVPGSGKSTLTAALSLRGWRLLSDEFGAFDPASLVFRAMLKPVALKNDSIGVIRRFGPHARFGPEFPKTRKGTVAHLAAEPASVQRRHEPAAPGAVILPRWLPGSPTTLQRLSEQPLFSSLAFNAFNYQVIGAAGFQAALHLTRRCPAWQLTYSDLDDALARLDALWPEVVEQQATWAERESASAGSAP